MTNLANPIDNPLEKHIGYWLRRASARMIADLASRLADHGISVAEASILVVVAANPNIRQSELGRTLGIQRANIAPMLIRLEQRDLIAREAAGGRAHAIDLTSEGRALSKQISQIIEAHEKACCVALSDSDAALLVTALAKLMKVAPSR